jgi:hypothetical protein
MKPSGTFKLASCWTRCERVVPFSAIRRLLEQRECRRGRSPSHSPRILCLPKLLRAASGESRYALLRLPRQILYEWEFPLLGCSSSRDHTASLGRDSYSSCRQLTVASASGCRMVAHSPCVIGTRQRSQSCPRVHVSPKSWWWVAAANLLHHRRRLKRASSSYRGGPLDSRLR